MLYLRFFAHVAQRVAKPRVIGVAGSVGKSSARDILYAALKDHTQVKNIFGNSETGIPLGLLGIKPSGYNLLSWIFMLISAPFGIGYLKGARWIIVEMGIDEPYPPRNMDYLLSIVKPEIAISLNISATHTLQFEELFCESRYSKIPKDGRHEFLIEKIAEDDCGIITRSGCKVGIYNIDNKYVKRQIDLFSDTKHETELLSFGKNGDVSYGDYSVDFSGTTFNFDIYSRKVKLRLSGYVLPREYQETIGACLLAAGSAGIEIDKAISSLEKNFQLPPGRSSVFSGVNNSVIIDSSYNASKTATIAFLELVEKLKKTTGRPVVFLFGDMRELGGEAEHEHLEVAKRIPGVVDYLYLVGPMTKEYVLPQFESRKSQTMWFPNSRDAGAYLSSNLPEQAILLVKGSQNTIFLEEAIKPLLSDDKDIKNLCRQEGYWLDIKASVLPA